MKLFIFSLLFVFSSILANAQDWQIDINNAKELALNDKKIILVFQGSDWCAPCIKLDKEIFSTDKFKDFAEKHFIMLKADFPRKKKNRLSKEQQEKNNKLAEMYNKKGYFPYVVVLNNKGEMLGSTGYKKVDPTKYIQLLNSF